MFEEIKFSKQGSEIKRLAQRKIGLLTTRIQQIDDSNSNISNNPLLSAAQKDNTILENNNRKAQMKDSIELCQVLIDNLDDVISFQLSIPEMNFLTNEFIVSYR